MKKLISLLCLLAAVAIMSGCSTTYSSYSPNPDGTAEVILCDVTDEAQVAALIAEAGQAGAHGLPDVYGVERLRRLDAAMPVRRVCKKKGPP